MDSSSYSSNEWYTIIQNWRNQKYYIPTINIVQPQQSSSNLSSLVTQILSGDDSIQDHQDITHTSISSNNNNNNSNNNNNNNNNNSNNSNNGSTNLMVDQLLKALKNEKDDILRINLLLFLQENSSILLEDDLKRFERVFSILQSLIFSQTDSYPIKSQVLTTITTVLICESLIKTNPKFIEIFIELLLDIISKINTSPDRLLRGSACNCLLEFELTYPCILSEFRPLIMSYCQQENTHLIQNYTVLLSAILQNVTLSTYEEANTIQNSIILSGGTINNNSNNSSILSNNQNSIGSMFGTIVSPTTNTLSLPLSSPLSQSYQQPQQQQLQQQQQHSSIRSMMISPPTTTTSSSSSSSQMSTSFSQQQQQQSYSSSNNLNNFIGGGGGGGGNSAQNSLNYGSSRRSALLPLPNIFTDSDPTLRNSTYSIPPTVKFSPISLERINNNNEIFFRSRSSNLQSTNGSFKSQNTTTSSSSSSSSNNNNNVKLSESFEKDIFKCASTIADQSAYLNQWGLVTIIQQLIPLIDLVSIPHNFFKNHLHLLYKLFFTDNTLQFHIVLYLTLVFPDLYSQDEFDYCLKRLISIINDISLSLENRIFAIDWLLSLPNKVLKNQQQQPLSIFQFYPNFYPTSFDSIFLKEAKLYALCKCLSNSTLNISISPDELLKSLICLEEFKHNNENSISTRIVFSNLLLLLSNFPTMMFGCIEKYLCDILINYPQFLNVIICLSNGIQNQRTKINLFLSLCRMILQLKPLRFLQYLPLVERVVVEDQIDPTSLLEKTFELVKRKKILTLGNWYIGNIILSICRRSLMYHNTIVVAKPLKLILSNLFSYFSNLEIRDRASFYQLLISHLPDDKIKTILNTLQNDETNVSGLLSTPLTSDKNKLIKSVPNFISISQILDREISNSIQSTLLIYQQQLQQQQQSQQQSPTTPILDSNNNNNNDDFEFSFQNYLSLLMDPTKLEAKIIIPYQIRYKKHINNNNNNINNKINNNNDKINNNNNNGDGKNNNDNNNNIDDDINKIKSGSISNSSSLSGIGINIGIGIGIGNNTPLKVYALLIQLQQSPYYLPINPIRIPYLCHPNNDLLENNNYNNSNSNNNGNSGNNSFNNLQTIEQQQQIVESKLKEFPYCYDIDLSFTPIYPIPTSFSIKMVFNDDEGKTCKSDGSLISIQFSDLFMNIPIPWNLNSTIEEINQFQSKLFNLLWNTNTPTTSQPIPMTNSVKQWNISRNLIKKIINLKLSKFLITINNNNNDCQKEKENTKVINQEESPSNGSEKLKIENDILNLLIFLPPQFHLLLKFDIGDDSTIVYIKTDYWRCLVFLDQYLSSLINTFIIE
ncbi:hypothetical protein ACTFIW_005767 [Dictyostelium discoideum]